MFRDPHLRNIFIASLLVVLALPAYSLLVEHRPLARLPINNTEVEAVRLSKQLQTELLIHVSKLEDADTKSTIFQQQTATLVNDLQLYKLRVFSNSGRILFSTESEEIGQIDRHDYFRQEVSASRVYARTVHKNGSSLEGEPVNLDTVEVYIPLMSPENSIGAFEIYLDITKSKTRQDAMPKRSTITLLIATTGLIAVMTLVFHSVARNFAKRQHAEKIVRGLDCQRTLIIDSLGEGVYGVDFQNRIVFINPTAKKTLEQEEEELRNRNQQDLLHPKSINKENYFRSPCPIDNPLREYFAELIDAYLLSTKKICTKMPKAAEAADSATLQRLSISPKSANRNIGARTLSIRSAKLRDFSQCNLSSNQLNLASIANEMYRVAKALKSHFSILNLQNQAALTLTN